MFSCHTSTGVCPLTPAGQSVDRLTIARLPIAQLFQTAQFPGGAALDAAELVHEVRGFRLLPGYRGHPPAGLDALQHVLLRVSRLAEAVPEIAELDLNPVIALAPGQGCRIVDARITVRRVIR